MSVNGGVGNNSPVFFQRLRLHHFNLWSRVILISDDRDQRGSTVLDPSDIRRSKYTDPGGNMANYDLADLIEFSEMDSSYSVTQSHNDSVMTSERGSNWYGSYLQSYMNELEENPELYEQVFVEAEELLASLKKTV